MRMRTSRIIRLAPLAALLAVPAAAQTPPLPLAACTVPGYPPEARCGTLQVPENRDRPGGRQLSLHVVVIPASSGAPAREAITFFGGGPGQAATDFIGIQGLLGPARVTRDLLFVDQRGTGRSSPLECNFRDPADLQTFVDHFIPPERAAACRDSLARTADLSRYGFPPLAHDVDAVRAALGYERMDLWGGSYGTRGALMYHRMYPHRVRSMVLQGLVPPAFLQPADYATDMQAAVDGLMVYCRADAACNAAFPNAAQELRTVAERLGRQPATAEVLDAPTGRRVRLTLPRGTFVETIRRMLYNPTGANRIPYVVHQAHEGDFRPMLREVLADRRTMEESSWGLYLSIICSEDMPFIDPAAVAAQNGRTLLGDYRYRQQADACRGWPTYTPPAGYHQQVRSDVPTLLLSGELDPVTPPRWGAMAAEALPNALHVVVPGGAHGYGGMPGISCVDSLMVRFLVLGSAQGLDTSCVRQIRRPPFLTELPRTITLQPAALQRFAGTYASSTAGVEMRVDAVEDLLVARFSDSDVLVAAPTAPTRFALEGLPGFELIFAEDGSAVTLHAPDRPDLTLARKP
jgi:pimeloyl-ACP methyl ester carboxylesterase